MNIYMGVKRGDNGNYLDTFILHGERQIAEFGEYHIELIISSFI